MSREENRARMPMVTAFVDAFREVFGEDCKVIYASENGLTLGTPGPRGVIPCLPPEKKQNVQVRKTKRR